MKNVLFMIIMVLCGLSVSAQTDLTISPAGFFLGNANLYIDKSAGDRWSVELGLGYSYEIYTQTETDYHSKGAVIRLLGKYYVNKDKNHSGFYAGPYLRGALAKIDNIAEQKYRRLGLGGFTGYKWLIADKLVLELGMGVGYALVHQFDPADPGFDDIPWFADKLDITGKVSVGMRIGD
ncbi:DUF3575 domain-containing protein [Membranicola marinus]|uniref:DUF3575 domain-containing protein n=1 Tax=Membranihabitans marinus TaxID=1227546 RepID=A0A953I1R9_9BACT|nr:DUF3575 domain-containing protein [Membranihabitans marinus]MBY5959702.1 DUF3575 domain-containing protein [Membranihabitans marinus]